MTVEIRKPFPEEALPRVWRWTETFRGRVSDDFSPKTVDEFIVSMTAKQQDTWAIYRDEELGGMVSFEKLSPWLGTCHIVLKPEFQGQGITITALRKVFAEAFATGIGKLAFYPLAGNLAVGSLIVNLGGQREAKLRAHTLCGGVPTDVLVYGLTKEQFEGRKQEAA